MLWHTLQSIYYLVVLKLSHPLRPVFGLHASGSRPGIRHVPLEMPLERPKLFDPDFSNRPIQEQAVYIPVVPVQG